MNTRFYIIIPAHNEANYLEKTLQSLVEQTLLPTKVVVVNDASTDATLAIAKEFSNTYPFITNITNPSETTHKPGAKVVTAFYKGLETLDSNYNVLCKFDADLIFPSDYLERIATIFHKNPKVGIAAGILYIEKNGEWIYENIANKNHIRGPIKAYRKECFESINGIKKAIGWDTVDVLLANYYGWETTTDTTLQVKHLKPTGNNYTNATKYLQGEALYKMRYGKTLTLLSALKMAYNKKNASVLKQYLKGYYKAKKTKQEFIVTEDEGKFIRKFRWKGIFKNLS